MSHPDSHSYTPPPYLTVTAIYLPAWQSHLYTSLPVSHSYTPPYLTRQSQLYISLPDSHSYTTPLYTSLPAPKDTTLILIHNAYTHLERTGSFVWILFINFSSAFSTIQPHLMTSKLLKLNVIPRLIHRTVKFLVSHSKLHSCLPALFPLALHKVLSYLLFFLHSIQMTAHALTQHQS